MIDVGSSDGYDGGTMLWDLEPVAADIKRLKFERENTYDAWFHFESKALRLFANVKEIHIVCADGILG